jgi:hypothetical protein
LDIRKIFEEVSKQLLSEFRKTAAGISHPVGKGDQREAAFSKFLEDYLPTRYSVGRGEVITPENRVSGQLDIIIFDASRCPVLIKSESHSVYPIESVYGAISMKSTLDAAALKDGYENIASLKSILLQSSFTHSPSPGFAVGLANPMPATGIVAFQSDRSLESISAQARRLDDECLDIRLRPDFIAVIGEGIVGPRSPLRGDFNEYKLPEEAEMLVQLRKTGRHTLLRLYMQMLRELNAITLRPLDLHDYDEMPRLVGPYRVRRHNRFVKYKIGAKGTERVVRLNKTGLDEIVQNSKPVTMRQNLLNTIGSIPHGMEQAGYNLDAIIYEYNPNNLPPLSPSDLKADESGRVYPGVPAFTPLPLVIDDKQYSVDVSALSENHLEDDPDFTADELLSS